MWILLFVELIYGRCVVVVFMNWGVCVKFRIMYVLEDLVEFGWVMDDLLLFLEVVGIFLIVIDVFGFIVIVFLLCFII